MSRVGLALRLSVQVGAFLALYPVLLAARVVRPAWGWRIAVAFHRLFLRLFDIRVAVRGAPPGSGLPVLVVANHVSWLDIPVLAGLAPLSFIAKSEIAGWPVFGFLARVQRCVFIDRARKSATAAVNAVVAERLAAGDVIVLFPEGTTGDGNRLLPFRSSLVGAARNALAVSASHRILLQPLALAYRSRHGLPVTRRERPSIAWYGDMDLVPHALSLLRAGPLDVEVTWCEPLSVSPATDRKASTAAAEAAVRCALAK